MRRVLVLAMLLLARPTSAEHIWRTGVLLAVSEQAEGASGSIAVPVGGTAPITVPGALGIPITIPGTAPSYVGIPMVGAHAQYVTIESDGLRYVVRGYQRVETIINDPITFAIGKDWIYIKGPTHTRRYRLVSTTRLER